ncbi:MAG TPA: DUF4229 domain-containing protein [Aeromicrobium sp.]|nr:DUF4229 domain-containing protein [Aeromicrobium sp.]
MIKYTIARLGVFLATWVVLLGLVNLFVKDGGAILNAGVLLVAVLVSSVISLFALSKMRNQVAEKLAHRASAINDRIEESRRAEDVD